jgi:hypothetical protein
MQLLRDNLTLWTSNEDDQDGTNVVSVVDYWVLFRLTLFNIV